MERKVCFISDVGNLGGAGRHLSKGHHSSPCTGNQWGKSFYSEGRVGGRGRVTCGNSTVSVWLRPGLRAVAAHVLGMLWGIT